MIDYIMSEGVGSGCDIRVLYRGFLSQPLTCGYGVEYTMSARVITLMG